MRSGTLFRKRQHTIIAAAVVISFILTHTVASQENTSRVSIDRNNKQNITGTTEIAFAWGQQFQPPQNLHHGLFNLMDAMNSWTMVETSLNRKLMLSDKRIMNYPFVFITTDDRIELTQTEISNLRDYISNGGFLFVDNADPISDMSTSGSMLKKMLEQVIPDARFDQLQNSSDIYHSFFDFSDGPPVGAEFDKDKSGIIHSGPPLPDRTSPQRLYLEGVRYKGRLVAVYSDKGYIVKWAEGVDNDPQLKMGVNLIIYALTQEGSLATQSYR